MKSIYLIGFMGSGKSSSAKALSVLFKVPYVDTDKEVEKHKNSSIPEIFAAEGEASFRKVEMEVLMNLPTSNYVIATGGGIIGREENRKWMKEKGIVIFLETSWETIEKRLGVDPSRPLWNGKGKKDLFLSRQQLYKETADIVIHTDEKTSMEVAEEIMLKIKKGTFQQQ